MKTTLKNLGKAIVMIGCTAIQFIAIISRFVGLVFESIGQAFSKVGVILMNISSALLAKLGMGRTPLEKNVFPEN